MQMKFCSCLSRRGELLKAGFSAKIWIQIWKLKKQIQFNFLSTIWLLDIPKIKRENYPRKYFWLAGVKFDPG